MRLPNRYLLILCSLVTPTLMATSYQGQFIKITNAESQNQAKQLALKGDEEWKRVTKVLFGRSRHPLINPLVVQMVNEGPSIVHWAGNGDRPASIRVRLSVYSEDNLYHELAHVALAQYFSGRNIPRCLNEGFANWRGSTLNISVQNTLSAYLSYQPQIRFANAMRQLPTKANIYAYYGHCYSVVAFLIEKKGVRSILQIMQADLRNTNWQRAFFNLYGFSVDEVDGQVRRWAKKKANIALGRILRNNVGYDENVRKAMIELSKGTVRPPKSTRNSLGQRTPIPAADKPKPSLPVLASAKECEKCREDGTFYGQPAELKEPKRSPSTYNADSQALQFGQTTRLKEPKNSPSTYDADSQALQFRQSTGFKAADKPKQSSETASDDFQRPDPLASIVGKSDETDVLEILDQLEPKQQKDFKEGKMPLLVLATAKDCDNCRADETLFKQLLAPRFAKKAIYYQADVNLHPKFAEAFKVTGLPEAFLIYRKDWLRIQKKEHTDFHRILYSVFNGY